jgi:hypothetical protein
MFALLAAALFAAMPAFAADFVADLDPASHDNSLRLQVQGEGQVKATLTGNRLVLSGKFSDLTSSATKARLGQGRVLGAPADSFFADLTITSGASGTIAGTVTLTPDQLATLNKHALFIQIDAVKTTPAGSLWGWFLPVGSDR